MRLALTQEPPTERQRVCLLQDQIFAAVRARAEANIPMIAARHEKKVQQLLAELEVLTRFRRIQNGACAAPSSGGAETWRLRAAAGERV